MYNLTDVLNLERARARSTQQRELVKDVRQSLEPIHAWLRLASHHTCLFLTLPLQRHLGNSQSEPSCKGHLNRPPPRFAVARPKGPSDERPRKQKRLRSCVEFHCGMVCESRDGMFVSCVNRPILLTQVWGGEIVPKLDCNHFDPSILPFYVFEHVSVRSIVKETLQN